LKEREFNQSYLLAKRISHSLDIPLLKGLLSRIRYTRAQSGLSPQERERNVAGAFRINPKLKNSIPDSQLLLIDDIITTGSTVRECINEIRKFEAEVIVLTVAGG
jgi:predicted amidophosphoribosyltransferase